MDNLFNKRPFLQYKSFKGFWKGGGGLYRVLIKILRWYINNYEIPAAFIENRFTGTGNASCFEPSCQHCACPLSDSRIDHTAETVKSDRVVIATPSGLFLKRPKDAIQTRSIPLGEVSENGLFEHHLSECDWNYCPVSWPSTQALDPTGEYHCDLFDGCG